MTNKTSRGRRGFVSVFVLVAMVGAVLIATASLMRVTSQSRASVDGLSPTQVDLLFESARDLANTKLAEQPQYKGESWQFEKPASGLRQAAQIIIKIESNADPNLRNVEVTVEFGDNPATKTRDRKTWTISLPASENAS